MDKTLKRFGGIEPRFKDYKSGTFDILRSKIRYATAFSNLLIWTITDDPLKVGAGGAKFEIDLGAERIVAADRGEERIAIEIKTFASDSPITDYHAALGQFLALHYLVWSIDSK